VQEVASLSAGRVRWPAFSFPSARFYESHLAGNTSGLIAPSGILPRSPVKRRISTEVKDISKRVLNIPPAWDRGCGWDRFSLGEDRILYSRDKNVNAAKKTRRRNNLSSCVHIYMYIYIYIYIHTRARARVWHKNRVYYNNTIFRKMQFFNFIAKVRWKYLRINYFDLYLSFIYKY